MMTYGVDGYYDAAYTYGVERIEVEDLDETRPESQDPLYYLYDGLGSVAYMVKPDGNIRDHYNFDEYGKPAPGNSKQSPDGTINLNNAFGYTGEMWDEESNLLYLRARYYEPETGRFLSRDTYEGEIENPLSKHLYAYVGNNPVNRVDPSGLTYLIAWSYGSKDVEEYEQYLIDETNWTITVDGDTSDWNSAIWDDFTKRSSFARAAYTKRQSLLAMGIPASDIDVQRIDSEKDLEATWDMWTGYSLIEELDFYSHGYSEGAEVYGGSGYFWDTAQKLNFGSSIR